ncbi:hypothetical protein B0H17DRAFT_1125438 [Mycena rosella]|uniref:Uncharacterized protein n=1 Tax=Mycena rosella TaxID=1033263 RepID=A0AAD7MAE7_MYCRO|nr:hypothetical protein B0H17DRAFT_1125438 [Mycena rosella]
MSGCRTPFFLPTATFTTYNMLCSNRFPLPGSPSTCTLDTAIVPLPSFFLLVALAANLYITRRQNVPDAKIKPVKWLHIAYLVLVGAQIVMTILELVRLALEHLGVGLLPVNTIALISVFVVLWRERTAGRTRSVLLSNTDIDTTVYWFFLTIFLAVKTARLNTLVNLNPTTTKTSQYPSSDWFLDNAVMVRISPAHHRVHG